MTNQQYTVRQAQLSDLGAVMSLLQERVEWLREKGSDQWSTWTNWQATKIRPALEEGRVWLLLDQSDPVGTITVEFCADSDFWTPQEYAEPAAYLSKLAIRLEHSGKELGSLLIDWSRDYAYRHGCKAVRLDAWKTNAKLQAYYSDRGWRHVRTADVPGRNSGSLFELPVQPLPRAQRGRLNEEFPVVVLDDSLSVTLEPDAAGNWSPGHVHRGGVVLLLDAMPGRRSSGFFIDFMRYRLRFNGDEWHLESVNAHFTDWRREGILIEATIPLREDETYIITHQDRGETCRMVVALAPHELGTSCRASTDSRS